MAVGRRKRLAGGSLTTTTLTTIFTAGAAPADGSARASVKVNFSNVGAAAVTIYLGGPVNAQLIYGQSLPVGGTIQWPTDGYFDMMGGETLQLQLSAANRVDYMVYGVEATDT